MRIGDANPDSLKLPAADQARQKLAGEAGRTAGRQAAADAVTLSVLAEALAETETREDRVAQLRAEVQAGSYQVPALNLAEKIIDDAVK